MLLSLILGNSNSMVSHLKNILFLLILVGGSTIQAGKPMSNGAQKKVLPSRAKPLEKDFKTPEQYVAAFKKWQLLREINNESVKRSRARGTDEEKSKRKKRAMMLKKKRRQSQQPTQSLSTDSSETSLTDDPIIVAILESLKNSTYNFQNASKRSIQEEVEKMNDDELEKWINFPLPPLSTQFDAIPTLDPLNTFDIPRTN